jgi:hypothetical protein
MLGQQGSTILSFRKDTATYLLLSSTTTRLAFSEERRRLKVQTRVRNLHRLTLLEAKGKA